MGVAEFYKRNYPDSFVDVGTAVELARIANVSTKRVRKAFEGRGTMRVYDFFVKLESMNK